MTDLILKYSSPPHLRIKNIEIEKFPEILTPYFRKSRDNKHLILTSCFFRKIPDVYRYDLRYCHK
jgi:hypothetical protein